METLTPHSFHTPPHPPVSNPEELELEELGERIAALSARIAAATFQLLILIREFDQRHGWSCGFRSCAQWLNWRTGLAMGAAREKVRVARALADLPATSEAMSRGKISYSKVRAITRVATPANEMALLALAGSCTAAHVERVVRAWRRVDRIEAAERDDLRHASRYLNAWQDEDGMVVVRGRLEPETGAVLMRALEAASEELYRQRPVGDEVAAGEDAAAGREEVPPAQLRADALGRVAEAALAGGLDGSADGGSSGDRYQVVVHVDAAVLADPESAGASTLEGSDVSAETSRRVACDAGLVVMAHDSEGRTVDVGRKTRSISPALRRALTHRDRGCRFPGCSLEYCEAHHIHHWAAGGETSLDNLVLLCRRHHRCVHEEGCRVERERDGTLGFFRPDGRRIPEAPPLPDVSGDALGALLDSLIDAGIEVNVDTGPPDWDGGTLDLAAALDGLMPIGRSSGQELAVSPRSSP